MKHSATSDVGPDESGRSPSADVEAARSLPTTVRALGWTSFLTDFALFAMLPGLATLAVIWAGVRDAPRHVSATPRTSVAAGLSKQQAWLLGCVGVWAVGAASEQFLLLRTAEVGVPAPLVPLVWFGMSLAKSGAAARAGRLADRVAPRAMLALGWLLFAAAYGGLALTSGLPAAVALVVCVGVAYGIAEPAERALVASLAADGRHGAAFGWYALVQGLMALPAGLLAGWLWDSGPRGPAISFAVTAALAVAACGLLFLGRTVLGRTVLTTSSR